MDILKSLEPQQRHIPLAPKGRLVSLAGRRSRALDTPARDLCCDVQVFPVDEFFEVINDKLLV